MRAVHFVLGGLVVAALLIGFYIGFVLWEPSPLIRPLTVEKIVPGEATERTVKRTVPGPERTVTRPCEGTLPDTGGHR